MRIMPKICFSLAAEDKAGELLQFAQTLKDQNVDLEGLWGFGIGGGKAQIIAVPKDPAHFRAVVEKAGLNAIQDDCFRIEEEDRVGALVDLLKKVADKGINLHAVDAMAIAGKMSCYIWADRANGEKLKQALRNL